MSIKHPTINPGGYAYIAKNPSRNSVTHIPKRKSPILCPTIHPGVYPHYGKEPNSGKLRIAYEEKFQKINESNLPQPPRIDPDHAIIFTRKVENRVQYHQIQRDIKKKVEEKINAYEEAVDKRRARLKDLVYCEERQYYRETVEKAFKGEQERFEEMKRTVEMIRAKREEERQQLVHKKRIQQYINLCEELKPTLIKKHLIESKNAQFQQMRENEARRQADKELDNMWAELSEKENKAKIERAEREEMAKKAVEYSLQETLAKQIRGKELFKAEEKKMKLEDKLELERINEKMRMEELEKLKQKRKDQESLLKDLKEQVHIQEELLRKRKEEDEEISKVYQRYNLLEVEKEKAGRLEKLEQTRKESAMYNQFLQELEVKRKQEEKRMDELMEIYRKEVQKKFEDAQCKLFAARKELQKNVMEGRAQQLALKRQEAENQLKAKQAENELLSMYYETNARLQYESDRLEIEAAKQYRDDLKQQIEYNNIMRERERQELERQLQKGKEEEEKYQKLVKEIITVNTESPEQKHPFRRILEKYDCRCKEPPF